MGQTATFKCVSGWDLTAVFLGIFGICVAVAVGNDNETVLTIAGLGGFVALLYGLRHWV